MSASIPIESNRFSAFLLEPGIIENAIKPGVHLEVKDMLAIKKSNQAIAEGAAYSVLVTSGHLSSISNEARILTASSEFAEGTIAKALLISSMGHRIVGNFYLTVNRPALPTQIFTERQKALDWLRQKVAEQSQNQSSSSARFV
jgi:hypothetical protein